MTSTCSGNIKLRAWPRSCVIGCTFSLSLTNILNDERHVTESIKETTFFPIPIPQPTTPRYTTPQPQSCLPHHPATTSPRHQKQAATQPQIGAPDTAAYVSIHPAYPSNQLTPFPGRSRRPRPRPRPLNPPHHPRRPSPLLRLRARLHAPHSPGPDLQNPARLHLHPVNQSATAVRQHHRKRQRGEGYGEVQEEGPEVRSHHDGDSAGRFAGFLRGCEWWGEAGVCGCDGPREEVCVGGCY